MPLPLSQPIKSSHRPIERQFTTALEIPILAIMINAAANLLWVVYAINFTEWHSHRQCAVEQVKRLVGTTNPTLTLKLNSSVAQFQTIPSTFLHQLLRGTSLTPFLVFRLDVDFV